MTSRIGKGEEATDWLDVVIAAALGQAGRDPGTPIRLVENATLPSQRVIATSLGKLLASAPPALDGPALMLVGEVCREASAIADSESPMRLAAARECRAG